MKWLPHDELVALVPLPPEFRLEPMQSAHIAAVIAALHAWYPDITFGANSGYMRSEFYHQRVCLDGADDKDVQAWTIWCRDELVGIWSVERESDSLAVFGRVVVIAPQHAGTGLMSQVNKGMEAVSRKMGAAFLYTLATLKHPYLQQALERAGYRLLGFFPGYDRQLVAPGVVKRVYLAAYAKLLVPEDSVLRPDPRNLTPRAKALFDLLFSD